MMPVLHEASRPVGVDVAQLLRDIGEASASTDPVELFRLCLAAQRVLLVDGASTQGEPALLANYRALNEYGRNAVTSFAGQLRRSFARPDSLLSLVQADPHQRGVWRKP